MSSSIHSFSKEHSEEPKSIHTQSLHKLYAFIEQLSTKFEKLVENLESAKLEQYKDDLLKTKGEFDVMKQTRSDNAIKKAIKIQKKNLEKQCANFLQKSQQVSKIHGNLKTKLITMVQTQQELQHEIKYLHKQIKHTTSKQQRLKKQLKIAQQQYQSLKLDIKKSSQTNALRARDINQLTNQKISKNPNQEMQKMNRTKKYEKRIEQRLLSKIQNTKQYIDSLVFQQSTIEQLFSLYDPHCYKDDKKKIALMESLLSQDHVKKSFYYLLFKMQDD